MAKVTQLSTGYAGTGEITASNGVKYAYSLRRVTKWNVGLRRHANQLTGEITVHWKGGLAHYADWAAAFADIEKYAALDAE